MPMNTFSVAGAVVPSVIETYFSHYLFRAPLKEKPTAHISYHEGLKLIRQFLDYSSKHTVEDLQQFTAQWVPCPHWVRLNDAEVVPKFLERAAALITSQLGRRGIEKIGGRTWWQWRRPESPLRAEWIEMKKEYHERKRTGAKCERVILYVHGGAYYFGSVDEHRYQLQRHARKLRAQVLAPRYRLAPQFPFPCGLYDCLATYFYLLEHFAPSQILFAGDSAGGGMVLSLLVTLRDQGQPLPAGTILLSPWVDLTHSFPSVAGDGEGDYIPPHGFLHKPSMAWPPPPVDEVKKASGSYGAPSDAVELPAMVEPEPAKTNGEEQEERPKTARPKVEQRPTFGPNQGIYLDGQVIELKEQIQLYTTNELLAHPLVSPVMQPTLGGLPPMLIQVGGAELLRDEQIYIAHKAANPKAYLPADDIMDKHDPRRELVDRYPPTDVQLQVWDDLCHVPHTLSFTRPAKYMYRSVAQFGAWALAHAQHKGVDIPDDDAVSFISSNDGEDDVNPGKKEAGNSVLDFQAKAKEFSKGAVGKAGDPLPPFKEHMIRQRVTRHGVIYPLPPPNEMQCLAIDPSAIGMIKAGPVRKWLQAKSASDQRFAGDRKKIDKKRAKEAKTGYDEISGEYPPPTALVGRLQKGVAPEEKKKGKSWGLAMWSGWGSSHDENTLQREEKAHKQDAQVESLQASSTLNVNGDGHGPEDGEKLSRKQTNLTVPSRGKSTASGRKKRRTSSASMFSAQVPWAKGAADARPRSRDTRVNDTGQADEQSSMMHGSPARATRSLHSRRTSATGSTISASGPIPASSEHPQARSRESQAPIPVPTMSQVSPSSEKIPGSENTFLSPTSSRPHNGQQAYPFRLRKPTSNPSIATLDSARGTPASASHSELAGDAPTPVELPEAAESKSKIEDETSSNEGILASTLAAATSAAAAATATVAEAVMPRKSVETETTSPTVETPSSPAPRLSNFPSPPMSQGEDPAVSPVQTPAEELDRSELVSPLEDKEDKPLAQPRGLSKDKLSELAVVNRNTIFDHRTSTLGSIGADGMPIAHHEFPLRHTIVGPSSPVPPAAEEEPVPAIPAGLVNSNDKAKAASHSPGSSDESKTAGAPFKLRNPVYDARDVRSITPDAGSVTPQKAATPEEAPPQAPKAVEQPKAAPFKLRHTVVDLTQKRANSSEDTRPMMPAPLQISRSKTPSPSPASALDKEKEKEDKPPSYDSSTPLTNVVLPETLPTTSRPTPVRASPSAGSTGDRKIDLKAIRDGIPNLDGDRPPPPPPKDEKPRLAVDRNKVSSKRGEKGSNGVKSTSGSRGGDGEEKVPKSKFSANAPSIGELGFEKKAAFGAEVRKADQGVKGK